jgi:hypothetical protein
MEVGEECPNCEIGIMEDIDDYNARVEASDE